MQQIPAKFVVRTRWWLPHYITGMAVCCALFVVEPDLGKVQLMIVRAIYFDLQ